jgi:hypothetical protein
MEYSRCAKTSATLLSLCALVGWAGLLHAQVWRPLATPEPSSLVTTGGITYVAYSWEMNGCEELNSIGPLIQNGGNFSFDFELEVETGVPCADYVFEESATVVLGALAPGAYTLTTTSWGAPVWTNIFTVPTNSRPTLQPIGFAADGSFQIQLNGVANVGYVLQGSTNLVNWTSLSTNSDGGQPLTNTPPVSPGWRYYRVQIPQLTFGPALLSTP